MRGTPGPQRGAEPRGCPTVGVQAHGGRRGHPGQGTRTGRAGDTGAAVGERRDTGRAGAAVVVGGVAQGTRYRGDPPPPPEDAARGPARRPGPPGAAAAALSLQHRRGAALTGSAAALRCRRSALPPRLAAARPPPAPGGTRGPARGDTPRPGTAQPGPPRGGMRETPQGNAARPSGKRPGARPTGSPVPLSRMRTGTLRTPPPGSFSERDCGESASGVGLMIHLRGN